MERPIKPYLWKKEYELDVKILDERHRKFLEIVNQVVDAINDEREKEELPSIFFKLMDYVENYFLTEEIYFKEYQFCDFEKHQEGHNSFVKRIAQFQDDHSQGKEAVAYELLGFLTWWIQDRILKYDADAIKFLKENGIA
ncbi:MAG: bacteriohemerythrin [Marinifilaceae bacterium]